MRGRRAPSTPKEGELMGELKRADRRCDVLCSGTWCLRAVPGSRFVCLLSFQCWLQGSVFKVLKPAPIFNLHRQIRIRGREQEHTRLKFYMACADARCKASCGRLGYDVGDGRLGNVALTAKALRQFVGGNVDLSSGGGRVAVCLTGQIRALPLAFLNWQHGPIGDLLKAGDMRLDLFMVTSNTSSLRFWRTFVHSLRPVEVAVVQKYTIAWFPKHRAPSWAFQEADGVVKLNPSVFPSISDHKVLTALIQHWQLQKCAELIRRRERATGVRYARAARLRTDVVYGGPSSSFASALLTNDTQRRCALQPSSRARRDGVHRGPPRCAEATLHAHRASQADACARHLRAKAAVAAERLASSVGVPVHTSAPSAADAGPPPKAVETPWFVSNDLLIVGSRDAVVDGLFQGMRFLPEAKAEGRTGLRNLLFAWLLIRARATGQNISNAVGRNMLKMATFSEALRSGNFRSGECADSAGAADIVRLAGPPVQRFFLQHSEGSIHHLAQARGGTDPAHPRGLLAFCTELLGLNACLRLLWDVPLWAARDCLGIEYDQASLLTGNGSDSSPPPPTGAPASKKLPTHRAAARLAMADADVQRHIAHAASFGVQLIGDADAHGKSSGTLRHTGGGLFARRQQNDGFL